MTDPNDPKILWERTDPGMGFTWSRPEVGKTKINGEEKFVAFVGGGYSTTDGVGNTFYVMDVEDGTILRQFVVGDNSNKIPSGATAFDNDLDGRTDAVYFGDIQGTLWKIKIEKWDRHSLCPDINPWEDLHLYKPQCQQYYKHSNSTLGKG